VHRKALTNHSATHILRHSFSSIMGGLAELSAISKVLGHQSIVQTQHYSKAGMKEVDEAFLKFEERTKLIFEAQ
jgi:site-specific recombinase XerD